VPAGAFAHGGLLSVISVGGVKEHERTDARALPVCTPRAGGDEPRRARDLNDIRVAGRLFGQSRRVSLNGAVDRSAKLNDRSLIDIGDESV
jgi:hypothetical protein